MIGRFLGQLVCLAVLAACHEHGHDGASGADDHGHHGHHGDTHGPPEDDRPTAVVTLYRSDLELFMEYPVFVQGEPSRLIVHLTATSDPNAFVPVTEGRVTASLGAEAFVARAPARPGVFLPVVTPPRGGTRTRTSTLAVTLHREGAAAVLSIGRVQVYPSKAAARQAVPHAEEDAEPTVSFLKEAQWKTRYATSVARLRTMRAGVAANGTLRAVPGRSAELSAPVRGLLVASERVPHVGMPVRAGQRLVEVAPLGGATAEAPATVDLAVEEARTTLARARRDRDRIRALVEAKALPQRRLDEAHSDLEVAEARARAAGRRAAALRRAQRGRAVSSRFALTSPIDGEVAFARINPGAIVGAGQRLLSVVQTDRLWLEAHVYEDEAVRVRDAPGAAFTVSGLERVFETESLGGSRVAVGPVVDAVSRTVPVIFAFDNPGRLLKPGMYAKVTVYSGDTIQGIAVPETALVDHGGQPSVFVMRDGETFVQRRVWPGIRAGGLVQILNGLQAGERVVSQGAYEIKLAASGGMAPAHGHAH